MLTTANRRSSLTRFPQSILHFEKRVHEVMTKYKMHRFALLEEGESCNSVIIHGFLKIVLNKESEEIVFYHRNIKTGRWKKVPFPSVVFVPMQSSTISLLKSFDPSIDTVFYIPDFKLLTFYPEKVSFIPLLCCILEIAKQLDYKMLALSHKRFSSFSKAELKKEFVKEFLKKARQKESYDLNDRLAMIERIFKQKIAMLKNSAKPGFGSMNAYMRKHIYDKEMVGILSVSLNEQDLLFSKLLHCEKYKEGLKRVSSENRNLLPISVRNPSLSSDMSFYSRKNWVCPPGVDEFVPGTRFLKFQSTRTFNFLKKLPITAIRRWVEFSASVRYTDRLAFPLFKRNIIENMAHAEFPPGTKKSILTAILSQASGLQYEQPPVDPCVQRLYRFAGESIAEQWEREGFQSIRGEVSYWHGKLSHFMDWYRSNGKDRGLPDKNATLQSLLQQIQNWEDELSNTAYGVDQRRLAEKQSLFWDFVIPEITIDNYFFKGLSTYAELQKEGMEMNHCVASYWDACESRCNYRVYSVSLLEENGERATLGISQNSASAWVIDQIQGEPNSKISGSIKKACNLLISEINKKAKK